MSKAKFKRSKPHIIIGTIGHVDHGRATLSDSINKVLNLGDTSESFDCANIDKTHDKKTRGITINAAHIDDPVTKFKKHFVKGDDEK